MFSLFTQAASQSAFCFSGSLPVELHRIILLPIVLILVNKYDDDGGDDDDV